MTGFFVLVLGVVAAILWRKSRALERRLRVVEPRLDTLEWALRQRGQETARETVPEPPADPVSEPAPIAQPAPAPQLAIPSLIPARREEPVARSEPSDLPAPPTEPLAPAEPVEAFEAGQQGSPDRPRFDFEDLFGRLLPIWAGGVALAVAGFFLVRYSIEQGLLGPTVRTAFGFLFGTGLIAGAEIAYRQEHRIADPRVRQALAGAGLATLYASFYMADSLYGLIGPGLAFVGLALVTAAAIGLSFRFGLPSAILGLVGGFAAPTLVGSDDANLSLLALYLALVTAGLSYAGMRQGRSWLALAALAGGLGWGVLMLLSGVTGAGDIVALGGYLVVLGAVIPAVTAGPDAPPLLRAAIGAVAAIQMAVMVALTGFDLVAWMLFLLLGAALAFFAWREPRLREASGFAALLSLPMFGLWSGSTELQYLASAAGLTAIFALVPLAHLWRGQERIVDVVQIVAYPLALAGLVCLRFADSWSDAQLALSVVAFAAIPALASWRRRPAGDEAYGKTALATLAAAASGLTCAGWLVVPQWAAPVPPAAIAAALALLGWRRGEAGLSALVWTGIGTGFLALGADPMANSESLRLVEMQPGQAMGPSVMRWAALLVPALLLALRPVHGSSRALGEILATLVFYGLAAQLVPGATLGWLMAALAVGLAFVPGDRTIAAVTALAVSAAWALDPLAIWLAEAARSLAGEPMMVAGTLGWAEIGQRILPPLLASAVLARTRFDREDARVPLLVAFAALGSVTLHIAWKQVLSIASPDQFVTYGFAERTLWEAVLLAAGWACLALADRKPALRIPAEILAAGSLAHFACYSLLLHNPMATAQAVGVWPLVNLVALAGTVALGAVELLRRLAGGANRPAQQTADIATMALITLVSLALLRQAFAGTILLDPPVGGTEDLLRSLLGIVLAVGFLGWGAYRDSRSWRIGSLVLMLLAVLKVFLLDAAGLEGLARIASFMALGFSLIGIGWFYTRQLRRTKPQSSEIPS